MCNREVDIVDMALTPATQGVDIGSVDLFQVHYRTVSFSPALMK